METCENLSRVNIALENIVIQFKGHPDPFHYGIWIYLLIEGGKKHKFAYKGMYKDFIRHILEILAASPPSTSVSVEEFIRSA